MRAPMLGHLDPEFQAILDEVAAMLGDIYRRRSGLSIALSATGTGGLEAGLAALIDPGETAIVGSAGFFGDRIAELARRRGADVIEVRAAPGCHVPTDAADATRLSAIRAPSWWRSSTRRRPPASGIPSTSSAQR